MNLPTELPPIPTSRLAVRLTPDALRQVRGGHPWIFESSIRRPAPAAARADAVGALAVVFGDRREFVAIGLHDPDSPIRVRVLHRGSPATIDGAFWRVAIDRSLDRRAALLASTDTTGMRLVHGDNDAMSGFVVDRYDTTLVVKLYSRAWFPHLAEVLEALVEVCGSHGVVVERLVIRLSRQLQRLDHYGLGDGVTVYGAPPAEPIRFRENGLWFEADVVAGQKTGHFLDQRDNRQRVRSAASGRTVLDVFACTGGFSVHAAAGGATDVVSVDLSHRSLDTAERNMAHNRDRPLVAACNHRTVVGDAFDVMSQMLDRGARYDLVIVDPPSFAQKERDRAGAIAAYGRLANLGLQLTARGGTYVQSSCSSRVSTDEFRAAVIGAADDLGRQLRVTAETGHTVDHPVDFAQGSYLKTLFGRLDRGNRA